MTLKQHHSPFIVVVLMTVTLGGDTAVPAPGVWNSLTWSGTTAVLYSSVLGLLTVLLTEPNAWCQGGQSKPKGNLASRGVRKHSKESRFKWAYHYSGIVWVGGLFL